MGDHQTIELFLTQPQFAKYRRGKTFQLTNSQLQADSGKHQIDIHLAKSDYNKLLRAIKSGKGYRLTRGPWLWQFGRGKPRLGGLSVEKTQERMQAARDERNLRAAETRRRCNLKADRA